ncbi:MAG: hypothetical protein M1819_006744 [Sarea resinae]|nr:MAG: hypothetical protein M1819_006744 [Sarea resinae]
MVDTRRSKNSSDSSSSANGDKAKANTRSSGSQSKPTAARAPSTKGKAATTKKGTTNAAAKDMGDETPHTNGTPPVENGVNGTGDVEMGDSSQANGDATQAEKEKNGDEERTVVVPPSKGPKLSAQAGKDGEGDEAMQGVEATGAAELEEEKVDPVVKAISDIKGNFSLLERAVAQFDARYTLRVLRSISSVRKRLTPDLLAQVITETYQPTNDTAKTLLAAIGKEGASFQKPQSTSEMEVDTAPAQSKAATTPKETSPEVDVYLSILVQIFLYDSKAYDLGAKFSSNLVDRIRTLNRRTLDSLSARVYFYYSLFYEELAPRPPSPMAAVISIRQQLLSALRTAVLRKDQDTQATVTTLLLRNYLSTSHISQADLLVSQTQFPPAASNNQIARYLYYLGRIRAIQLSYTEAHDHLVGATRKSPSSATAAGFYQASNKLLIIVELLMGDIPDRALFRQPSLEHALQPYFLLVQAVRVGDLEGFLNTVQAHSTTFKKDGTYTLILRLRQNVIKTGVRMMSLSYSRISLRDICLRLGLDSEESAEYIVAKAIRDGVIEATLNHEKGFMKSKEVGDIYATREPGEAFHERIQACLSLHDESVKAMRFPMNQHRLELKNAQEARERERELAKEIQEGDINDDDAGGDFEGMIEVPVRLRRAILVKDLLLIKRITTNNPKYLQNPDFADRGNTSLHLAAKHGTVEIVTYLLDTGHEDDGLSRNADGDTPLIYAAEAQPEIVEVLVRRFPSIVNWRNKRGIDALMTASLNGQSTSISHLLSAGAVLTQTDNDGNTALHFASAYGQLKVLRQLLDAGANPGARNAYSWTPVSYSLTVAAEVYFRGLMAEVEKRRLDGERERERAKRVGGVRLVIEDDGAGAGASAGGDGVGVGNGAGPQSTKERERERERERDTNGGGGGGGDWSPVIPRGAPAAMREKTTTPTMTPAAVVRAEGPGWGLAGLRTRAGSGD